MIARRLREVNDKKVRRYRISKTKQRSQRRKRRIPIGLEKHPIVFFVTSVASF